MRKFKFLFFILVSLGCFAQNNQSLFQQGNTYYNQGKYTEAIQAYEAILKTGNSSAEVYFNLANANYKLNHVAPSIYYYEKALQLKPNDTEIRNNLAFAQKMTLDAIDVLPEVGFDKLFKNSASIFSADTWAYIAVLAMLLFLVSYFLFYSSTKKRLAFIAAFSFLLLAFVALFFAYTKSNIDAKNNPAIIFAEETAIKNEPNLRSQEAFKLHEGTKVQVIDTINDWKKIQLTDGKTGWVYSNDIKLLKDNK